MDPVPASLAQSLADRYRLEREIGSGGMATVYLAKDVRHDRDVAVKVLRPEIASSIGVERFLAEIKTTAHLQHPHILGLIDSGEVNGTVFYVMPFVKGESLRDRLSRELQMPVADAVRIATQVAGALDYAHRHGVIHRDIKPENILLHDEQALVADFGIALAASRSQSGKRITEAGTSLGTPHYMSPEQAMGERSLDARADIYALGCVLYEMLTGEPPFDGPNAQAIIAKVMTAEPEPVTTVRKTVPTNVAAATMMAISKLPADRFPTAAAFAAALENVQFSGPRATALLVPHGTFLVRKSVLFGAAAAALLAFTVAFIVVAKREATNTAAGISSRFEIPLEASMVPNQVHVSRDGRSILWSASGAFWERPLDSLTVRRLRDAPQTQGGIRDISPDGREVLVGGRGGLSITSLAPGASRELGVSAGGRGGASWADNGNIFVGFGAGGPQSNGTRGVIRVPATGGTADTIASWKSDRAIRELIALPGGNTLLAIQDTPGRSDVDTLVAIDVGSGRITPLTAGAQQVRFVPPNFVLYTTSQALMAAKFNAKGPSLSDAVPFAESNTGFSALAASRDLLVYRTGGDPLGEPGIDVRNVNGSGARSLPGIPDTILFSGFTVSPDGRRLAASGVPMTRSGNTRTVSNIYIYELPTGPLQPLRSNDNDYFPSWIGAGRELSFTRLDSATGQTILMHRPWDGSSSPDTIFKQQSLPVGPVSWMPNGKKAVAQLGGQGGGRGRGGPGFGGRGAPGGRDNGGGPPAGGGRGGAPASDLMFITLPMNGEPGAFMRTDDNESSPAVSPDGRLVAYVSNTSGKNEVYVSPIDGSSRRRVSRDGGAAPKWSRSGHNLFFRNISAGTATSDTLFTARIEVGSDISVGEPSVVFTNVNFGAGYGVLPGDSLFVSAPTGSNVRRPLVVVTNLSRTLASLLNGR